MREEVHCIRDPAEAIEAIEDPDIREVLEELLADSIAPERRPPLGASRGAGLMPT